MKKLFCKMFGHNWNVSTYQWTGDNEFKAWSTCGYCGEETNIAVHKRPHNWDEIAF